MCVNPGGTTRSHKSVVYFDEGDSLFDNRAFKSVSALVNTKLGGRSSS